MNTWILNTEDSSLFFTATYDKLLWERDELEKIEQNLEEI